MRIVVTGHAPDGRAVFVQDHPQETVVASGFPGLINTPLWTAQEVATLPDSGSPGPAGAFFPPDGGVRFFLLTMAAAVPDAAPTAPTAAQLAEAEELFPGLFSSMEAEAPGMHTSDSIDFVVVLSGTAVLELDDGAERVLTAGDAVVQHGTRHRWRNESADPVTLAVTMLGTKRA